MRLFVIVFSLFALASACAGDSKPAPPVNTQTGFRTQSLREMGQSNNVNHQFMLYVPSGEKPAPGGWPLVIYLHGAGSKGHDGMKPRQEVLPRELSTPDSQRRFPCFILVPQCREGNNPEGGPNNWVRWNNQEKQPSEWTESSADPTDQMQSAMAALQQVTNEYPIDPSRIYLTGVSMGGSGSFNWAARTPRQFAAVMPVCGLSEISKAPQYQSLPMWIFHGAKDAVVPVERSRALSKSLAESGHPVRYSEFPQAGHNIAAQAYLAEDKAALEWLFQQRLSKPKQEHQSKGNAADETFFETRIRPVLVQHCQQCHGSDKQRGSLRVDSRASLLQGGDLGPAVLPGDPDESPLMQALRYEGLEMPPRGQLDSQTMDDFAEWITRGAPWPEGDAVASSSTSASPMQKQADWPAESAKTHWAFQPVAPVQPPSVEGAAYAAFVKSDVDRFVVQRMEQAKILPAPAASAASLARRLSLDLIGLPPTPERVGQFCLAYDQDPDGAVGQYVDELLASPHYGERWGRHWLDVARYADTNGSEVDHAMAHAWRYRDYVVRSFNDDKPYDEFLREQIAGDLMEQERGGSPDSHASDQLTATGFLMLGPKALAELDKRKLLADVTDEQIDTMGRAMLGLTLGCARCHDHKFDPISARDYYALAGIFQSCQVLDTSKRVATWIERPLTRQESDRHRELSQRIAALQEERDEMVSEDKRRMARAVLAAEAPFVVVEAEDFVRGNLVIDRRDLGKGIGVIRTKKAYPDQVDYEIEVPKAGNYQLELRYAAKESRPTQLLINGEVQDLEVARGITGDWKPAAQRWERGGVYAFDKGKNTLSFRREGPMPLFDKWLLGPVRSDGGLYSSMPLDLIAEEKNRRSPNPRLKELDAAITAATDELDAIVTVMAPFDGPGRDAPVLIRGNVEMPGETVPRRFPEFLSDPGATEIPSEESGRRELAIWIADRRNPLTARVMVNRVWAWHFGRGLVPSVDNFGLRGDSPSHPELLDWLANWFVENNWSIKKLNRLLCTSGVFRQEGGSFPEADPDNVLLSRWPTRRLDAEQLRDAMLQVAGNLEPQIGGSMMTVANRTYATGGNATADIVKKMHYETVRRSLYVPIARNSLYDLFAIFDYPEPGSVTGQRAETNVPTQALFLMNSPLVIRQSKVLAGRLLREQSDQADPRRRLELAYRLVYSRSPSKREVAAATDYLKQETERAKQASFADPQYVAWQRLSHALLMSNEFLELR